MPEYRLLSETGDDLGPFRTSVDDGSGERACSLP